MHEIMMERARDLGRLLGQTEEYKAMERARQSAEQDDELKQLAERMDELERKIGLAMQRGEEPAEEDREAYESTFSRLQGSSIYQSLAAAQSNFDKLMRRVNEEISKGLSEGSTSRIIMPS